MFKQFGVVPTGKKFEGRIKITNYAKKLFYNDQNLFLNGLVIITYITLQIERDAACLAAGETQSARLINN